MTGARGPGACVERLEAVIGAAERLGLGTEAARAACARARQRLGFPGGAFVLALAGGTGAGKSSLLNALAGREVSPAGPRRPVTEEPLAWIPAGAAAELRPLLDWVGVRQARTHDDPAFAELAIIDLPDYDSVERAHRARVDELLPKVDAILWVLDPEKYADRVLHEDYLRPLAHHAGRMVVALNRQDVLGSPAAVAEVVQDLRERLAAGGVEGVPVFAVSAAPPDGRSTGELEALRAWLSQRMAAKKVVAGRVVAECLAAGEALGRAAGVGGRSGPAPLVGEAERRQARERVLTAARLALDTAGVRRACERRTWAEARERGAGPLGRLAGAVARLRGGRGAGTASARSTDPAAYARAWRSRASTSRLVNPLHELARQAAGAAPPALRPRVMAVAAPEQLERRLASALDEAAGRAALAHGTPPRSWLWPLVGVLQTAALAAVLAGGAWYATLAAAAWGGAGAPDVPALWGVPVPLALVAGGAVAGMLLARLLRASAAWKGARWADRLTRELDRAVAREVEAAATGPLAALEADRSALAERLRELEAAAP